MYENEMSINFKSISQNEGFARIAVAAFLVSIDPNVSELTDIKTAVSEAVTNAIIHGYGDENGEVFLGCRIKDSTVYIEIRDSGKGIENVEKAKKPLFTTKPELERSGMGFTVMEAFVDEVRVVSELGKGTTVFLTKKLSI